MDRKESNDGWQCRRLVELWEPRCRRGSATTRRASWPSCLRVLSQVSEDQKGSDIQRTVIIDHFVVVDYKCEDNNSRKDRSERRVPQEEPGDEEEGEIRQNGEDETQCNLEKVSRERK